jgi:hypothetical protein
LGNDERICHWRWLSESQALDHIDLPNHVGIMQMLDSEYWPDHILLAISIFSAILLCISAFADRKRQRRTNIENVGFMPWTAITVFSAMIALMAGALAYKAG